MLVSKLSSLAVRDPREAVGLMPPRNQPKPMLLGRHFNRAALVNQAGQVASQQEDATPISAVFNFTSAPS